MAAPLDANLGSVDDNDASTTSITLTTGAAVAAGAFVRVSVGWFSATATLAATPITGTNGLTWATDQTASNVNDHSAMLSAQAPSGLASGVTIVANFSVACTGHSLSAESYTGVLSPTAIDTKSAGTSNVWATATLLTTNPDDLLLSTCLTDGSSASPGATTTAPAIEVQDFTDPTSNTIWTSSYRLVAATGNYSIAGTWTPAGSAGVTAIVAYKAVSTAASPTKSFNPIPFQAQGRNL